MRLVISDLGHRFAGQPFLFRHLDLILESDGVYAITGPSGSGKSTLLSLLAGWLRPTEGEVIRGNLTQTGWVFQNPHGVARRTALDHVRIPFLARGIPSFQATEKARGLMSDFQLEAVVDRVFAALSGGEAQRLMLARAVAASPEMLLVDEPTAQLDTATAAVVNQSLTTLADRGVIVVVATHDLATRDACTTTVDLTQYVDAPHSTEVLE